MSKWHDFYKTRDPDRYLAYAKRRYEPFIAIIAALAREDDTLLEAGCGLGTITRALAEMGAGGGYVVVDNCEKMLCLAGVNLRDACFSCEQFRADITKAALPAADIVHSHGVLEHFTDEQIQDAIAAQIATGARALVHYVPGEKYDTPSFGDERLMSMAEWRRICHPHAIVPFNDGFDYALVWTFPK